MSTARVPFGAALAAATLWILVLALARTGALAGTTGNVTGTVLDAQGKAPLAGVQIDIVAPSGRYRATTSAKGFFAITGVSPDTYTLSFTLAGYEPASVSGITVFADQTQTLTQLLTKELKTVGRVTARSPGGAFQPSQATNAYTVTANQIQTILGKDFNQSETSLIVALPGASLDSSGYPVLRGGRENEEGFQFEGIDYTDAFTSQFINSLAINGAAQLQLIPGSGDASNGNTGTGIINIIAKRGSYPGFGDFDLEAQAYPYLHQLGIDFGIAAPSGRISEFISFIGQRSDSIYGAPNTDAARNVVFFAGNGQQSNDLVNNLVYKFGPGLNQSLQFFYQNQQFNFPSNYGGIGTLTFKTASPEVTGLANALGFTTHDFQSIVGLDPYQQSPTQMLTRYDTYYQPNDTFKLQYADNLDSSTFLTTKYYQANSVVTFDFPYDGDGNFGFPDYVTQQGGQRVGFALDGTKQLGSKHLLQLGGKYEFLHPVFNELDPIDNFYINAGFGNGESAYDFLPLSAASCSPSSSFSSFTPNCGYLYRYFPNGPPRIPPLLETTATNRNDSALYVQDTFTPNDRLKLNVGLRADQADYRIAAANSGLYLPNATGPGGQPIVNIDPQAKDPIVFEPHLNAAYELGRNDALRFSYGRTVEFAPLGDIDYYGPPSIYNAFANIPSYDNTLGEFNPANPKATAAQWCGVLGNLRCSSYAQQLYWNMQNNFLGVPLQPARPETFNNFDFSYSHQFAHGISAKVTPFYRRGYDALALAASIKTNAAGQPILNPNGTPVTNPPVTTNLGINRTTGAEFLLTKDAEFGLSGSLSATYINEFSNVIPLSSSEDFFPFIPPQSLALGNVYRVGFISPFQATLALQYKTHGGWRINPVISFNKGYPISAGLTTPVYVNGVAINVPNTNLTSPNGSPGAPGYVDPLDPGSYLHPNIVATRGTPETSSAGGILSNARAFTNLTIEYTPPRTKSTFGVAITNLFDQLYSTPTYNGQYEPVATGIAGPFSGYSANTLLYPRIGYANFPASAFGGLPYNIFPNNTPIAVLFYYQQKL
jgi:outer membrane receptor protein involved in Fe transport